jgi:hypothetical protein
MFNRTEYMRTWFQKKKLDTKFVQKRAEYRKHYNQEQRKTYLQSKQKYNQKRMEVYNRLKCAPCTDCGKQYNPWIMQFDHRDPSNKSFQVSRMATALSKRVLDEIKKCDLVCANCHADRTHLRRLKCKTSQ